MLAGCKATALAAADQIDSFLTDEALRSHPLMPTFNELYLTTRLMVLIRFGLWAEVLATTFKPDAALYAAHTLFLHYARGVAFGATGDVPSGREEERAFLALLKQTKPGDRRKHNVDIVQMAEVASEAVRCGLQLADPLCFGRRRPRDLPLACRGGHDGRLLRRELLVLARPLRRLRGIGVGCGGGEVEGCRGRVWGWGG